jgi:peroxiredoxin
MFGGAFALLAGIAIVSLIWGFLANQSHALAPGKIGPDFTLPAEQGGVISLHEYRGQVVVLEFFAPWCPHCRNEVSTLNQVARTYAAQGVQVLSVTATPYGFNYESTGDTAPITMADVRRFVDQFHVSYPTLLDTSLKAGNAYGVSGYPQLFVIDRNGVITWNNGVGGEVSYAALRPPIARALAVPLATATHTGGPKTPAAATATPRR